MTEAQKKSERIEFRISPTHSKLMAAHLSATPMATKAQFFVDATRRELLHPAQRRLWELEREISRATGSEECNIMVRTDREHVELAIPSPDGRSDWFAPIDESGGFVLPDWSLAPGTVHRLSARPVPFVSRNPDPSFPTRDRLGLGLRLVDEKAPYGGPIVALLYDGYAPRDQLPHYASAAVNGLHDRAGLVDPETALILDL